MIFKNPEFLKNVKLEFNLTRLGLSVIVIALIAWLAWNSGEIGNRAFDRRPADIIAANSLFNWLCGFGFFFSIVWGSFLVSSSQYDEIKQKTWDFVRMSSLSPFKIMVGKLFGAPSAVWLVSLVIGIPATLWSLWDIIPGDGIIRSQFITLGVFAVFLLAWTILSYAGVLFLSLSYNRKDLRNNAFGATTSIFLIGVVIGGSILAGLGNFYRLFFIPDNPNFRLPSEALLTAVDSYMMKPEIMRWYSYTFYSFDVITTIVVFFAIWAVIAAWQALRRSLQYRDLPWAWIGFLFTASILFNGFALTDPFHRKYAALIGPMLIGLSTMAMACLIEAGNVIKYKAVARSLSANNYYEAACSVPLWMISFLMFAGLALFSGFCLAIDNQGRLFPLALIAYVIRDLMVVHAITWSQNVRRPHLGIAVYFALAYGLIPAIAGASSPGKALLFFPNFDGVMRQGFWPLILVQLAIFAVILLKKWGRAFGKTEGTSPAIT